MKDQHGRVAKTTRHQGMEPDRGWSRWKPLCYDCGVIDRCAKSRKKGEGSGWAPPSAVSPAACSGARPAAAAAGDVDDVLGGSAAPSRQRSRENVKKAKSYEIDIRFDDGIEPPQSPRTIRPMLPVSA